MNHTVNIPERKQGLYWIKIDGQWTIGYFEISERDERFGGGYYSSWYIMGDECDRIIEDDDIGLEFNIPLNPDGKIMINILGSSLPKDIIRPY